MDKEQLLLHGGAGSLITSLASIKGGKQNALSALVYHALNGVRTSPSVLSKPVKLRSRFFYHSQRFLHRNIEICQDDVKSSKKRKGTFFKGRNIPSSSNSRLDAEVSNNEIRTGIQNSCAKERKVPNLNASFSTFEGNIDYHEGTQRATVNTQYVYAMRSIGRGAEAGRMFCAILNLPQPPTRFAPYNKSLLNAVKLFSKGTTQKATQEAVWENGSNKNIAVAVDGAWQKRAIKFLMKKKDCKRNFGGSSESMEVEGASRIFQRSLTLHDARENLKPEHFEFIMVECTTVYGRLEVHLKILLYKK
ncbi:uncharacterized protein NPIL_557541 [Nephila pilipes]|uniref:Mutator-like transposase domain-containing protein n=1 Tax=Nephila pilipes TaxID=299642 RepID=A0A8X6IY56_NEPPI|nr:uncharacterized protein NPIL_557541 [Nephila pilipes]